MIPEDVKAIAPDVIRHRLVLSYEAAAEGVTAERIIEQISMRFPFRRKAPESVSTCARVASWSLVPAHQAASRVITTPRSTVEHRVLAGARISAGRRHPHHRLERHRAQRRPALSSCRGA